MNEPLSSEQQNAFNRDVTERIKVEMGHLLQQIILLQAHTALLKRENECLRARLNSLTPANDLPERLIRTD